MKALFKRISGNRTETASDTSASVDAPRAQRPQHKILVVCKGCNFSRGVVDYAVNIAKKTRSSLVALNIDESGRDFDGFSSEAKRNIEYFTCKAAGAELAFSHEIQQGDENTVVARMHEKDPQFRYVMNDTAAAGKSRGSIPVYTRATLHAK